MRAWERLKAGLGGWGVVVMKSSAAHCVALSSRVAELSSTAARLIAAVPTAMSVTLEMGPVISPAAGRLATLLWTHVEP